VTIDKYRCPNCHSCRWTIAAAWRCEACGRIYPCSNGIPKLYLEDRLGAQDRRLRDRLYNGFLGTHYRHVMPFMTMPARPLRLSWPHWIAYAAIWAVLLALVAYLLHFIAVRRFGSPSGIDFLVALVSIAAAIFLYRHGYILNQLILALPVRLALALTPFTPAESFEAVHARHLARFKRRDDRLQVLDIGTGNCAALSRHGWLTLDADFTGVDLSDTMIRQGATFARNMKLPMEFALADATELPFQSETFDIVLNYGSINGMNDVARALEEMARVAKQGGLIFFLDEQLHAGASVVERAYFDRVLSSHDMVHRCPVELMPPELADVEVHQVYRFYYICAATKARNSSDRARGASSDESREHDDETSCSLGGDSAQHPPD
jgi:ubiquinone/menaquinone biosynthesis C-methylase UbiE